MHDLPVTDVRIFTEESPIEGLELQHGNLVRIWLTPFFVATYVVEFVGHGLSLQVQDQAVAGWLGNWVLSLLKQSHAAHHLV